ncbi:hypothetical protein [Pedobacter sp. SYSU D00535]|nr:hypothetical protein [Pedobacter sp. SYSU D00535]
MSRKVIAVHLTLTLSSRRGKNPSEQVLAFLSNAFSSTPDPEGRTSLSAG